MHMLTEHSLPHSECREYLQRSASMRIVRYTATCKWGLGWVTVAHHKLHERVEPLLKKVQSFRWSDMPTHTIARVCYLENYKRYFHVTTCQREVLSSSACMYNLNASAFYIALVLLHEYFAQKPKLLPYTTELCLQTLSISFSQQSQCSDRMFFLKLQACKFDFSPSMTSL